MNNVEKLNLARTSFSIPVIIWACIFFAIYGLFGLVNIEDARFWVWSFDKGNPVGFGVEMYELGFSHGAIEFFARLVNSCRSTNIHLVIAAVFCGLGALRSMFKLAVLKKQHGISTTSELNNL